MQERQGKKSRHGRPCANFNLPEDFSQRLRLLLGNLPENPRNNYLREQCFSKFVSSETDAADVRRNRAVNKWLAAERNNEATNVRLTTTAADYQILPHVPWSDFVSFAQTLTESIVGAVPSWDSLVGIFSGGASTRRNRTQSHPALKYLGKADVTQDAFLIWEDLLPELGTWHGMLGDTVPYCIVPGNVMFVVPKNAEIDRCACKEPEINMFMQKGLGGAIRSALRRVGIDLNDQSRNRLLAKQGSSTGTLATLDLSSASDSVSISLVEMLMPPIWFGYLSSLRSPFTDVFGELHRNEMFSSMGNGFTFELESLLFYVLARTTAYFRGVSGVISVYGDDIIVPTALAQDLIHVLSYMGFSINTEKSFWEGPFRESCGGHYFDGQDITPFYVKGPVVDLQSLIHLGNALRLWAGRASSLWLESDVYELWMDIKSIVPKRFWGGRDLSSKEALVTPDLPCRRLLEESSIPRSNGAGGYLLWLNAAENRLVECEGFETSSRRTSTGRYRVRPNATPHTWMLSPFFIEEWRPESP